MPFQSVIRVSGLLSAATKAIRRAARSRNGNGSSAPAAPARLDSTNFARAGGRTGAFSIGGRLEDLDGNGRNDTIVAVAGCPAGTQMTGGGSSDLTATGLMFLDAPDEGESWVVAVAIDENTVESPADVTASVVCYNPRGAVTGGFLTGRSALRELSPDLAAKVTAKATTR